VPWFTAALVRGAHIVGPASDAAIGDLVCKLIEAPDAEAAYARALELGEASTETYVDDDGIEITYGFVGLAALEQLPAPPTDGMQLLTTALPGAPGRLVVSKGDLAVFQSDEADGSDEDDEYDDKPGDDVDRDANLDDLVDAEPFDDSAAAPLKPR